MNFGCIPIVTSVGGMPEIVENTEILVKRNIINISRIIQKFAYNKNETNFPVTQKNYFDFHFRKEKGVF